MSDFTFINPPTRWQRLVSGVYSSRPTYVIVNERNEYFVRWYHHYSLDYNGEYESSGFKTPKFDTDYKYARVFEQLFDAQRLLKAIGYYQKVAVVGPSDSYGDDWIIED